MGRKLAESLYLTDKEGVVQFFEANSEPPRWAAKQITNEAAWQPAEGATAAPAPATLNEPPTPDPDVAGTPGGEPPATRGDGSEPPAGNATTEAWQAYAELVGVPVPEGAGREDIKALLVERGLLEQ